MSHSKIDKNEYFIISFERFIELITEMDNVYFLLTHKMRELFDLVKMNDYISESLSDYMEAFIVVDMLYQFLNDKANNPTRDEVDLMNQNDIKDVLFTKEELSIMESLYSASESKRELLAQKYNFSTSIN